MAKSLDFYITTRSAAEQMATDEALLSEDLRGPLLSVYQWNQSAITGGRGTPEEELDKLGKKLKISNYAKRRSGGGIVVHRPRLGLTYALAIPRLTFTEVGSIHRFYTWLHQGIQRFLIDHGVNSILVDSGKSTPKDPCFTHPVTSDLVSEKGEKIAGAGIWVSKKGFLIQGEIQPKPRHQIHLKAKTLIHYLPFQDFIDH